MLYSCFETNDIKNCILMCYVDFLVMDFMDTVKYVYACIHGLSSYLTIHHSLQLNTVCTIPYSRNISRAPIFEEFMLASKILSSKILAASYSYS